MASKEIVGSKSLFYIQRSAAAAAIYSTIHDSCFVHEALCIESVDIPVAEVKLNTII